MPTCQYLSIIWCEEKWDGQAEWALLTEKNPTVGIDEFCHHPLTPHDNPIYLFCTRSSYMLELAMWLITQMSDNARLLDPVMLQAFSSICSYLERKPRGIFWLFLSSAYHFLFFPFARPLWQWCVALHGHLFTEPHYRSRQGVCWSRHGKPNEFGGKLPSRREIKGLKSVCTKPSKCGIRNDAARGIILIHCFAFFGWLRGVIPNTSKNKWPTSHKMLKWGIGVNYSPKLIDWVL